MSQVCSTWVISFSHRANRLAQERTRTGEREALWVPCARDTATTAPPTTATRGCARELLSDVLLPHQKLPRLRPRCDYVSMSVNMCISLVLLYLEQTLSCPGYRIHLLSHAGQT